MGLKAPSPRFADYTKLDGEVNMSEGRDILEREHEMFSRNW